MSTPDILAGSELARLNKEFAQVTKAELDTPVTFEELRNAALEYLPEITFLASPYRVIKGDEKHDLIGVPFYIRSWRFTTDQETGNPYVIVYLVTEGNDSIILTDGSTGIFSQLEAITTDRVGKGHASPVDHLLVVNGLRVSEYGVTADGKVAREGDKVAGKGATFYLA